ncbi:MAG: hypothetical protein M1821_006336 [Bathelium mastoideum]|nr:MAG: hypothetical protein M1821_006336 [Bathelium mastoideum]
MAPSRGGSAPNKKNEARRKEKSNREGQSLVKGPSKMAIPLELQQRVLDIFKNALADKLNLELSSVLQEVKQHLYNREFDLAFGRKEYLQAYATRWSPTRALGYLQILSDITPNLLLSENKSYEASLNGEHEADQLGHCRRVEVACLGAGAGAEITAFAAYLHRLGASNSKEASLIFNLTTVDIADWSSIVENLCTAISLPPMLSPYASSAVQAASLPLAEPGSFKCYFRQSDLLKMDFSELQTLLQTVELVTLMFTLNELYGTSLSQTHRFLLQLGTCLKKGALFLVVDSPGSYSTVQLNGKEKRYPMQWLLDHSLTNAASDGGGKLWEKLVSDESRWFRLPERLSYPIELENMRYQIHLYRRL